MTPNGTSIPDAPEASKNYGQPWTYTDDRQLFGTLRGEFDITDKLTVWAAGGMRQGKERNALTNLSADGKGNTTAYRFDNVREDNVSTGEVGLRGKFATGPVKHTLVLSAAAFRSESKNAYAFGNYTSPYSGSLYSPTTIAMPTPSFYVGASMNAPLLTESIDTHSIALADTLGFRKAAQRAIREELSVRATEALVREADKDRFLADLRRSLEARNPASVEVLALLRKPEAARVEVTLEPER